MAVENVELVHELFPQHKSMGIVRMQEDKETGGDCKRENNIMENKENRHVIKKSYKHIL